MSIEFRCTGCQALLRTRDEAAGRPFACPKCGAALVVPAPEMPSAPRPLPGSAPPEGEPNPYQAPQTAETAWRPPPARGQTNMAVASIVLGATSLPAACCCTLLSLPLSIAGLVTGVMGLKTKDRGLAIGGIVLSAVGLLLTAGSLVMAVLQIALQNHPMFR